MVAVDRGIQLVGEEHIGARFLHQLLHAHIHLGPLRRVGLDDRAVVQVAELFRIEPLPVPHADLLGREPGGREARVRLHREAVQDQLEILPGIARLLVAYGPEGAGIVRP